MRGIISFDVVGIGVDRKFTFYDDATGFYKFYFEELPKRTRLVKSCLVHAYVKGKLVDGLSVFGSVFKRGRKRL